MHFEGRGPTAGGFVSEAKLAVLRVIGDLCGGPGLFIYCEQRDMWRHGRPSSAAEPQYLQDKTE